MNGGLLGALRDPEFYRGLLDNTRQLGGGLLAGTVGAPVDILTMLMRPAGYKVPDKKVMGSSEHVAGLLGLDSKSLPYQVGSLLPTDPGDALKYGGLLGAGIKGFHGSPRMFDALDAAAPKTTGGGLNNHGVFISPDEKTAHRYATDFGGGKGFVYGVDADVQRPLNLSARDFEQLQTLVGRIDRGESLSELQDVGLEVLLQKVGVEYGGKHPIQAIKDSGYDAIAKDAGQYGIAERELLVFDPKRVKIESRSEAGKGRK